MCFVHLVAMYLITSISSLLRIPILEVSISYTDEDLEISNWCSENRILESRDLRMALTKEH